MKTFMFPGQGSQKKGMGGELFDEFKELTEKADKILGYSIKELCLEDPRRELNNTQFTQPALYVVNALSFLKTVAEQGKPDYVAGHSLGEFNALHAAGVFDFEAGLKLVKKRGELMSKATGGGMAAIMNASKEDIERVLTENNFDKIELANYNTQVQIVISGDVEQIGEAQEAFKFGRTRYYPLNTSGAFHSRFMKDAQTKFATYLKRFKFDEPEIPVIANVTAEPYAEGAVFDNISAQIASTVQWCDSVQYLLGVDPDMEFVELGGGDVLTKMVATIKLQNKKAAQETEEKPAPAPAKAAAEPKVTPIAAASVKKPQTFLDAEEKVSSWNAKHPVGTKVKSTVAGYEELETRSEAIVLFGHRAAVYMKGYNGYFDLNEVQPA
jgi:malonyl CoA-acyl carrier protein transacylase